MQTVLRIKKLLTIATEPIARSAFRAARIAPSIELRPLLARLGEVATVVDVGANVGQFSLLAVMDLRPSRVFAFEPLHRPAEVFDRVFVDRPEVTLHRFAVGEAKARAEMHVSRADDSSSLLPITARQADTFPGTEEVGTEVVEVKPLDAMLAPGDIIAPALLKIDVQGYELAVLRGAESLLRHFDWVLVELSFAELYEGQPLADEVVIWLHEHGFVVSGTANPSEVQADFLFRRSA